MSDVRERLMGDAIPPLAMASTLGQGLIIVAAAQGEFSWWWALVPIPAGLALVLLLTTLLYGPELLWLWWKVRVRKEEP